MSRLIEKICMFPNAVLIKELRQELKVKSFVHMVLWFHGLMALAIIAGAISVNRNWGASSLDQVLSSILGIVLLLVIPFRGASVFRKEEKAGELELMYLTRITAWQLISGKWLGQCLQGVLIVVSAVPYAILLYFLSGMDLVQGGKDLAMYLGLSMLFTAIGVTISAARIGAPRFSFILTVIGVIFVPFMLFSLVGAGFPTASASHFMRATKYLVSAVILGPFAVVLLLEYGASKIAPPSENHFLRKRLLCLMGVLILLLLSLLQSGKGFLVLSSVVLCAPLCLGFLFEESSCRLSACTPFLRGGAWRRRLGLLFYPGWPSGCLVSLLSILLIFGIIAGYDIKYPLVKAYFLSAYAFVVFVFPILFIALGTGVISRVVSILLSFIQLWLVGVVFSQFAAVDFENTIFLLFSFIGFVFLPLALIKFFFRRIRQTGKVYFMTQLLLFIFSAAVFVFWFASGRAGVGQGGTRGLEVVLDLIPVAAFSLKLTSHALSKDASLLIVGMVALSSLVLLSLSARKPLEQIRRTEEKAIKFLNSRETVE